MTPNTIAIPNKTWETLEQAGQRPVDTYCIILHKDNQRGYAWSPDGYGAYYYDTYKDLTDNH